MPRDAGTRVAAPDHALLVDAGEEVVAAVGDARYSRPRLPATNPIRDHDVRMPPNFTDEGIRCRDPKALAAAPLVLSQYVEERYATDLLAGDTAGLGYLLKDRVADVREFVEAARRVGAGGTALDPDVVAQLLARSRRKDPLERLSPREREVLELMAEGRSNGAIGSALVISDGAVEKHVRNIFTKLDLAPAESDHRRVLAVLRWMGA
jgi:DNA-binding NarL/FixJ family response regulator